MTLVRSVSSTRYTLDYIEALRPKAEGFAADKSYDALMHEG